MRTILSLAAAAQQTAFGRRSLWSIALATILASGYTAALATSETPKPIALANFDFVDTSGEPKDQSADHQRRLVEFGNELGQQLAESGKFVVVSLPCQSDRCSASDPGFKILSQLAKQNGARFLVIGGLKKMSTLVGWVEYSVLRVDDNRSVCDRLITYRGDTDESWNRAARFSADQIINGCNLTD